MSIFSNGMPCPLCGKDNGDLLKANAVISPWLRELARIQRRSSKLYICKSCEGAFFNYRYTDEEMDAIYSDYRGPYYTKLRSSWEPWYTESYNAAHNEGEFVQKRKAILKDFLLEAVADDLRSIVDVGGDLGQYIPLIDSDTKRYLLDLSNRKLVSGVSRISSLDELEKIDLIIYAHVLEHVPHPLVALQSFLIKARYVYVEVPFGVPSISWQRRSKSVLLLNLLLSFSQKLWGVFSSPSAGRSTRNRILRQSEHINFFNEVTISQLAAVSNANVLFKVSTIPTPDGVQARVIQALFTTGTQ